MSNIQPEDWGSIEGQGFTDSWILYLMSWRRIVKCNSNTQRQSPVKNNPGRKLFSRALAYHCHLQHLESSHIDPILPNTMDSRKLGTSLTAFLVTHGRSSKSPLKGRSCWMARILIATQGTIFLIKRLIGLNAMTRLTHISSDSADFDDVKSDGSGGIL